MRIEIQLFLPTAACGVLLLGFGVCVLGVPRPPGQLRESLPAPTAAPLWALGIHLTLLVARGLVESMDVQVLSYQGARKDKIRFLKMCWLSEQVQV